MPANQPRDVLHRLDLRTHDVGAPLLQHLGDDIDLLARPDFLLGAIQKSLFELAEQCNPTICGWWNYYGAFYRTAMHELSRYLDRKLVRWVQRKYKTLRRRRSLQ
ncbi:group II intron maturase-specific domain-containing protein [Paraburkholderia sp. BL6665CI2N2]|uniref:group II intron maturase-specific domain-containing protein n=1 Tax=Paraburkholderia sp. BL6665CI2N2 TaxID=1938806 RepID=UPI001FB9A2F0|nr:group II intron maturase-specific domain-containing protein [Paraburkholderia sp. BL6665CI2N2]